MPKYHLMSVTSIEMTYLSTKIDRLEDQTFLLHILHVLFFLIKDKMSIFYKFTMSFKKKCNKSDKFVIL